MERFLVGPEVGRQAAEIADLEEENERLSTEAVTPADLEQIRTRLEKLRDLIEEGASKVDLDAAAGLVDAAIDEVFA